MAGYTLPLLGNCSCIACRDAGKEREQERKLCSTTYVHVGVLTLCSYIHIGKGRPTIRQLRPDLPPLSG